MFAARSAIVGLAFLGVMYSALSFVAAFVWWNLRRMRPGKAFESAGFLFGLRIFPFAVSTAVTVFLTLPSFWLMERRSFDEEATTFVLAGVALLQLIAGILRARRADSRTRQAVAEWRRNSGSDRQASLALTNPGNGAPALVMLVGICRPQVMVSDMAKAVLSEDELRVAIRHELGHRRSWDNLKKLLINATPFPGMRGIEQAWREAAELAADDAAVETRQDALNLASALIKLSRPSRQWLEPELASGLVCASSAINLRVQRLLEGTTRPQFRRTWAWALLSVLIVTVVASNYGTALMLTHRLTELLVP
jgi:Zn-dependent protease with chaperone function